MREPKPLSEIREMITSGKMPGFPKGTKVEDALAHVSGIMAEELSILTGWPIARIKVHLRNDDLGMTGKIVVDVFFDPDLTDEEEPIFKRAMAIVAALHDSRPPIYPGKA